MKPNPDKVFSDGVIAKKQRRLRDGQEGNAASDKETLVCGETQGAAWGLLWVI